MSAGPFPRLSNAMIVPSADWTVFIVSPLPLFFWFFTFDFDLWGSALPL
jgi:hypothetical protein